MKTKREMLKEDDRQDGRKNEQARGEEGDGKTQTDRGRRKAEKNAD